MKSAGKKSLVLASLLMAAWSAEASLTSGTVTNVSGTRNIPYSQPTTVMLRWSMLRTSISGNEPGLTVSSTHGAFTDPSGRIALGTVPLQLSKRQSLSASNTFSFTETLRIPSDVLFQAYKMNLSQIRYWRSFTDCPAGECSTLSPTPSITYTLTGSASSAFGLEGYSIRFEGGRTSAVLEPGQMLRAVAKISVTGTGALKGVWEVATAASTAGEPFYKSLQLVNRQATSNAELELLSPVLPSDLPGSYLVRFRILEPEIGMEVPVLKYVVTSGEGKQAPELESMAPAEGATIGADTRFSWETVPRANSYKLVISGREWTEDGGAVIPLTGILVKSDSNSTSLTASLLARLEPGKMYWWTVYALDPEGSILAKGKWKMIRVPAE